MKFFLLTILAFVLLVLFAPIGLLYGVVASMINKDCQNYYAGISFGADQFGNTICSELFNAILIKRAGYKFGNPDQTVSFVLNENKKNNTLKTIGKILIGILIKLKDPAIQ